MATSVELPVAAVCGQGASSKVDRIAVEEPLEIRLANGGGGARSLTLTMRTPGDDESLVRGFLFAEGIIRAADGVRSLRRLEENVVEVELRAEVGAALARAERRFTTTSSCGVCGKSSLEMLDVPLPPAPAPGEPVVDAQTLHALPALARAAQASFESTGGLHATALFDARGALVDLREDVGRHNAMDKLVGAALLAGRVPLAGHVVLVSGRASFELAQKAAMAGAPILAAVGAPSSLAVELAGRAGMTLVGFLRDRRFNVYTGLERVRETSAA
jgi:FdhD protein